MIPALQNSDTQMLPFLSLSDLDSHFDNDVKVIVIIIHCLVGKLEK